MKRSAETIPARAAAARNTRNAAVASAFLLALIFLAVDAAADGDIYSSGPRQVSLLELYTSEGCSSCPPADRWLRKLTNEDGLWREFVPVALHVDYWNYLGWKDRFSSADFSARQRRLANHSGQRTVYTPGFMLDGREWKQWWTRRALPEPSGARPGELRVVRNDNVVDIRFLPTVEAKRVIAHVAVLGFGLETKVERGENAGKTLTHDFVVLNLSELPLAPAADGHGGRIWVDMEEVAAARTALAVWVSAADSPLPLQATGGWLE